MNEIPTSKVTQATGIIRRAILDGKWTGRLPGERSLARDLMISRVCLRKALKNLTDEGLLSAPQPSKRREIVGCLERNRNAISNRVLFFTPEPAHRAAPLVLEQVARLRYHLSKADLKVDLVTSPIFRRLGAIGNAMQSLVEEHDGAHWVLHQCPKPIQKWFSKRHIRATVLGSIFENVNLPNIDIDFKSASRHATGMLLGKGHRRLCLIRFRSRLAGDDLATEGMQEAMRSHSGGPLPEPMVLNHNSHVVRLTLALDRLFSSPRPPTGLIVLNHHHFLTAYSHLMSKGIRIPEDVSVISLSHDHMLDRLSPAPVSYTVGNHLVRGLAKMVINPTCAATSKSLLLVPQAKEGGSVATAVEAPS